MVLAECGTTELIDLRTDRLMCRLGLSGSAVEHLRLPASLKAKRNSCCVARKWRRRQSAAIPSHGARWQRAGRISSSRQKGARSSSLSPVHGNPAKTTDSARRMLHGPRHSCSKLQQHRLLQPDSGGQSGRDSDRFFRVSATSEYCIRKPTDERDKPQTVQPPLTGNTCPTKQSAASEQR